MDRIDMHIAVQALSKEELIKPNQAPKDQSAKIRHQVEALRHKQIDRQGCFNADLSAKACETLCSIGEKEETFLTDVFNQLNLSTRGFHRLLKVARTIADMRDNPGVELSDLQQALSFKQTLKAPLG